MAGTVYTINTSQKGLSLYRNHQSSKKWAYYTLKAKSCLQFLVQLFALFIP
jgi:hypothetical protein